MAKFQAPIIIILLLAVLLFIVVQEFATAMLCIISIQLEFIYNKLNK